MADAKTEKQKVQEITEKLEQGMKELFESEKYKTYLNTMRKLKMPFMKQSGKWRICLSTRKITSVPIW